MEVEQALKTILETVKYQLTIQQQEKIKEALEKLATNSYGKGAWNASSKF